LPTIAVAGVAAGMAASVGAMPECRVFGASVVAPVQPFLAPVAIFAIAAGLDKGQEFLIADQILGCLLLRQMSRLKPA